MKARGEGGDGEGGQQVRFIVSQSSAGAGAGADGQRQQHGQAAPVVEIPARAPAISSKT